MKKMMKSQKGFTLLELMIAIAIVALLAATVLPSYFQNQNDAKYSTALTQLQEAFPSAITRQLSRTTVCNATNMSTANIRARGISSTTVWGETWSSAFSTGRVTVTYPVGASDNPAEVGADLVTALTGGKNIASVSYSGNNVTVAYRCI